MFDYHHSAFKGLPGVIGVGTVLSTRTTGVLIQVGLFQQRHRPPESDREVSVGGMRGSNRGRPGPLRLHRLHLE